ncbi:hypothetical protein EC988_010250 [Linderina pennispora]|nr:hypothetical protein EC988_010250 [Linderina pennispora]
MSSSAGEVNTLGVPSTPAGQPPAKRLRSSTANAEQRSQSLTQQQQAVLLNSVTVNGASPEASGLPFGRRDSLGTGGLILPDAYVQLEYQRLELERQRLALDQERWREERAERIRWETMYREQWQEDREERRAFREREQHIWKILLSVRSGTDINGIAQSM